MYKYIVKYTHANVRICMQKLHRKCDVKIKCNAFFSKFICANECIAIVKSIKCLRMKMKRKKEKRPPKAKQRMKEQKNDNGIKQHTIFVCRICHYNKIASSFFMAINHGTRFAAIYLISLLRCNSNIIVVAYFGGLFVVLVDICGIQTGKNIPFIFFLGFPDM